MTQYKMLFKIFPVILVLLNLAKIQVKQEMLLPVCFSAYCLNVLKNNETFSFELTELMILKGKKHPQIKLQRLRKV